MNAPASAGVDWRQEVESGERFPFGHNWSRFLERLDEARIERAANSLVDGLGTRDLTGTSFLDVGCGSGLFSLAARRAGARVHSFDFDPESVACARELRRRFFPDDPAWLVEQGSVLDEAYLAGLGTFDVVYSWGVLHHTGEMWRAIRNVERLAGARSKVFIAIYNDIGRRSLRWRAIKRAYNRAPAPLRGVIVGLVWARLWGPTLVRDAAALQPLRSWKSYDGGRGMDAFRDVVDWVGGYPYEWAKPEEIFDFFRARGYELRWLCTAGAGHGCNQFVFERTAQPLSPAG